MSGQNIKEIYERQYAAGYEVNRLFYTKANETEYILTMHYIHKYLGEKANIIDIGAGGGVYEKELANEGHHIDALDLHPVNVEVMKKELEGIENVNVYQGDALNLKEFANETYDLVLLLGPVYHLHDFRDRVNAIKEAARVAKKGAPVFVAFVLQDAPLIEYIFQSENPATEIHEIGYIRETATVTENTGSSIFLHTISTIDELTDKVLEEVPVKRGVRFAQDGLSQVIREAVNNMSEDSYNEWIQYLIATAERSDLMGYSNHVVQVFIKE